MAVTVIVGLSATGKSTLALELANKTNAKLYHGDDYTKKYGSPDDLYELRKALTLANDKEAIVEGVLGFRLLRKGLQFQDFRPDKVILCHCTAKTRQQRYEERGKPVPTGQDAGLLTIYRQYEQLLAKEKHKPKFETHAS